MGPCRGLKELSSTNARFTAAAPSYEAPSYDRNVTLPSLNDSSVTLLALEGHCHPPAATPGALGRAEWAHAVA
jgi:hypothetical protein